METITRNLDALLAFHAVAREGSFTRGAEVLGTSKAMVSKLVQRLEAQLRTRLFHRTTRTLSLTEAGEALRDYSQRIFQLSDEAGRRMQGMNQGSEGLIKIAMPVSFGEAFAPSFMESVRRSLPKTFFELDLANEARDFVRDRIDFAIRATDDHHPDLVARYLGRLKDVICAAPSYLELNPIGRDPRELSKLDCILHSERKEWNSWELASSEGDLRVEVSGTCSTNQYLAMKLLCLGGAGVARLPYYLVADEIAAGRLIHLFEGYRIATHSFYLLYRRDEFGSRTHRLAKEAIFRWFDERREIFV